MKKLGLASGIGLVVADMIGVGVLLSAGFMALDLTPSQTLLCWVVGGVMAMAGARAYAAVAQRIPQSGGEYRYLYDLFHPSLGYLAGWTSLLVGFSAPVASAASVMGPFAETLHPQIDGRLVGAGAIVLATVFHAFDLRLSRTSQNVLVALKALVLLTFVAIGIFYGRLEWPTWEPFSDPAKRPPVLDAFMGHLVWVMFAYTGWNAAIYAAGEFKNAKRDVPRAMVIGCAAVAALYLAVNWVFVANLGGGMIGEFLEEQSTGRITLAHLITRDLLGPGAGRVISAAVVVSLLSSITAMMFVGPRVYAAMARDGFLPRVFAGTDEKPPLGSVIFQGAVAMLLFLTHTFEQLLSNVGAILSLASALTVLSLFKIRFTKNEYAKPTVIELGTATVYVGSVGFMLYFAAKKTPTMWLWIAVVVAATIGGYFVTRKVRPTAR
jgi:APA family basic amino acid/polyamine antiporter